MAESLSGKQLSAIQRTKRRPELQSLLFQKAKGLAWFDEFEKEGFLNPENHPRPVPAKQEGYVVVPLWPITEYLVTVSSELNVSGNERYAQKFLNLIQLVTMHAKDNNYGNYRTWRQFAKIIQNIPVSIINVDDLSLIDYWLEDKYERGLVADELGTKWLPQLLEQNNKQSLEIAFGLCGLIFNLRFLKKSDLSAKPETFFRFKTWYAEEISKKIAKQAGAKLGPPAVKLFEDNLALMVNKLENDEWSYLWRPAIEEHEQNGRSAEAHDVLVSSFRDCLLGYIEVAPLSAAEYVRNLLSQDLKMLRRVAIYCVDQKYDHLKSLLSIIITKEYINGIYRHELWHLLHNHYQDFEISHKQMVLELIQDIVVSDEEGATRESATAYQKTIWLSAIRDNDETINTLYKEYVEIGREEPKHPDFSSYMSTYWGRSESPIPLEQLAALDIDSLVATICSYKDDGKKFGEPGFEGLVGAFEEVVKSKSDRLYLDFGKFKNCDLAFIYPLIEVYRKLWNEKKELPWKKIWEALLNFCEFLVLEESFWGEEREKERAHFVANRHWIVGAVATLIKDGVESKEYFFDSIFNEQAERILRILLARQKGEEFNNESDAVFVSINSPRGKCLEAFINLTLHSCRLEQERRSSHEESWEHYGELYDAELMRYRANEYEFATLITNYLPNFLYMNREWVKLNLSAIFDQANHQKWLCAMQGYSYVGTVYPEVYEHLKNHGDFIVALDDKKLKDHVHDRVVENIVVACLNDFEEIGSKNTLINALIERNRLSEMRQLIWFIWTLYRKGDEKVQIMAFKLFPLLLSKCDENTREGKILLSKLCDWMVFINHIDPTNKQWLLKIAAYAGEDHNSGDVLTNLARLSKTQPEEAYEVLMKMLESYSEDYPEEDLKEILRNLLLKGIMGKRKAKDIVDAYIKHGNDQPRKWLNEIDSSLEST